MKRLSSKIFKSILALEVLLAIFILICVVLGTYDVFVHYIKDVFSHTPPYTYELFKDLLGHVLLLVIGLELSGMLIRHTPGSVIEILLFAIARKVLIHSEHSYELLIGVASVAAIFAIRKYLFVPRMTEVEGIALSAATSVKETNRIIGSNIPDSIANSLGGLVAHLSNEYDEKLKTGQEYTIADVSLEIVDYADGIVKKVKVEKLDH
ncbi:MAG TPA: hypothetical protein GX526_06250 [Thermoanaerobacterales bacterium]|nr:hypothetical protein [Thermoanaerobacterales bacterium]